MSLHGQLRDFSAVEILQLLGSQRKTGCLLLETPNERMKLWLHEGRLVSSRTPAPVGEDAFVRFLLRTRRISEHQLRALTTLQRDTGRDAEDLVHAGRYLSEDDLGALLERMMLDDLSRAVGWDRGTYTFDPAQRWTAPIRVSMNVESGLMEGSRRCDELKRFQTVFTDPYALVVRNEADPEAVSLGADEDALLAAVDGEHTVEELFAQAPMVAFEAQDALARLLEAGIVRFEGRRTTPARLPAEPTTTPRLHERGWVHELAVATAVVALVITARLCAHAIAATTPAAGANDVYAAAAERDLRATIELYARDRGHLPARLSDLSEDRWIEERHLRIPGHRARYRVTEGGADYELVLQPDR